MSIVGIVERMKHGGDNHIIINGGEMEYYTNPISIMGGFLNQEELDGAMKDNVTHVKISVSTEIDEKKSPDNNNTKPFKSYLYNILDNITI